MESDPKYVTIFAGNPGAGKSTLLSSLAGVNLFPGGLNLGGGMTTRLAVHQGSDGLLYGDTPGLDDIERREAAAREITALFKSAKDGIKLAFILTTEAGRIKTADLTTIKLVLDALPCPMTNNYAIVINCVTKQMFQELEDDHRKARLLAALVHDQEHKTSRFFLVPQYAHAIDESDAKVNVDELRTFLTLVPFIKYDTTAVADIKHDAFEELNEKHAADLEAVQQLSAAQLDEFTRKYQKEMEKQREEAREVMERFKSSMGTRKEHHREQLRHYEERLYPANQNARRGPHPNPRTSMDSSGSQESPRDENEVTVFLSLPLPLSLTCFCVRSPLALSVLWLPGLVLSLSYPCPYPYPTLTLTLALALTLTLP